MTHFESTADIRLGDTTIPAGRYTLWMLPAADGAQLIVSRLVDVFGTQYVAARDVGRIAMQRLGLEHEVERLSITVRDGRLSVAWGDASYFVPLSPGRALPDGLTRVLQRSRRDLP